MRRQLLVDDRNAADQVLTFAIAGMITISLLSIGAYFVLTGDVEDDSKSGAGEWIDPVVEIEDENHSHTDLMAHRLKTENMQLIDYHNLNCDGNVAPPAELDNVAGRPCYPEFKNVGPTPGDSSEIAIEGNFLEDCVKHPIIYLLLFHYNFFSFVLKVL